MSNYKLINGDLLESEAKYLCHQCNCVTTSYSGLAKFIFQKYPYSDIYSMRENVKDLPIPGQEPGNIIICGDGENNRYIINMIAQFYPGYAKFKYDTIDDRIKYFKRCLSEIKKINNLESIAFPYKIGCGLAGGEWDIYEKMIDDFASDVNANVYIYKIDDI